MIFVNHRINTVAQLETVPLENGIEIDVRYHDNDLILQHDPFGHHRQNVEQFENVLQKWQHKGPLILNIKTEGVEQPCIELMNKYKIANWFFLDMSMPYFVKYTKRAYNREINGFSSKNLAVRYSEFEPIEYAISFAKKVQWVWVDCFEQLPLNANTYKILKNNGFKICLVSPELQNHSILKIADFKKQIEGFEIDAVCTKHPNLWV